MDSHSHVIGIDLGTTNSVVAIIEGGEPRVIQNAEGHAKTPSIIAFTEDGQVVVGEIARRQAATQPQRTISSVKRLIGRFKDEIDSEGEQYPFELGETKEGRVTIRVEGQEYMPEQISALILQKLKDAAEEHLGEPVSRAVITVPAYFDDMQRTATMEAARMAGLEVLRLLNEPTAAAMAYGLGREDQQIVAVFDFGGGTFDFSVLDIDHKTFEVLTSTGDSRLGGDDIDALIVDHLAELFGQQHGIDLRREILTLRRLKEAAETAKCELSAAYETMVSLPFIAYREGQPVHLEIKLSRETLEEIMEPIVQETLECCTKALRDAGLKKNSITRVILVGGSTRIPMVQDYVEDFFGIPPFKGINPDEIVALGAATQGAVMNGELDEVVLLDVTPHCLGIEIKGNRKSVIIEKNSTIPVKVHKTFTTTENNQSFVNIHALQGDSEKAAENRSLGKFMLSGITAAAAGSPRIKVTFFVNADGIVEISATDLGSGAEKTLTISHAYLSSDERQASSHAEARRARRRRRTLPAAGRNGRRSAMPGELGDGLPAQAGRGDSPAERTPTRARPAPQPVQDDGTSAHHEQLVNNFAEVNSDTDKRSPMQKRRGQNVAGTGGLSPAPARSTPAPAPASAPAADRPAPPRPVVAPLAPPRLEVAVARAADPQPEIPMTPDRAATVAGHAPQLRDAEAAETSPRPAILTSAALSQIMVESTDEAAPPEAAAPAAPAAKTASAIPPDCAVPGDFADIVTRLLQSSAEAVDDGDAEEVYEAGGERFVAFCREHMDDLALQLLLAKFLIHTKQAEEARDVLEGLKERHPDRVGDLMDIYGQLVTTFPNYLAARKDRAALAAAQGDFATAMGDLEFVFKREDGDEEIADRLVNIYQLLLTDRREATVQFKLVKLYLRKQQLDAAIGLLQQLVALPEYRDRANKVLGLCFWQKGMRYLAWQKFRTLGLDEEMKDILYRLATDMEQHDELLHAKYALERIYEVDIAYRDSSERLKKIGYRLELQKDERYGGLGARTPAHSDGEGPNYLGARFEVIKEINRGSMGIVYKARDRIVDEIVAIKVLNDFLCADPQAVERFRLEARSARKLTHQNVVRIHDMFEIENKKIISMEYIEGDNLKTLLARHLTFTEDMVLTYLVQISEGLAYAHRLHIVHRDIKPANIMITDRNQVKITDFGIAKLLTEHQTKAGTIVMGTPLYMSPEQIEGGKIDHRCDIYSLGIMMYEMVCGQPPFHEGNIEYQHIHNAPPEIRVGVSERLRKIIMKCIEKDPAMRFQSVEEILTRII